VLRFFVRAMLKIKVCIGQGIAESKMGSLVGWSNHAFILRLPAYVKQHRVRHLSYDSNTQGGAPHSVLLAFSVGNLPPLQTHNQRTN
jgi:hypothetical protein